MTKVAKTESRQRGVIKSGPRSRTITVAKIKPKPELEPTPLTRHESEIAGLPPHYATAIFALIAGRTMTEAAKEAGICRQHLYTLKNTHAGFIAGYNAERENLLETCGTSLVHATHVSIRLLTRTVEDENELTQDRVKAAQTLLKTATQLGALNAVPNQTLEHRQTAHEAAELGASDIRREIESYRAELERVFDTSAEGQELTRIRARHSELENMDCELRDQFDAHEEAANETTNAGLRSELEQLCQEIESSIDEIEAESNRLDSRSDELEELRSRYVDQGCGRYEHLDKDDVAIHGLVESPTLDTHKDMMKNGFPWRNEIGR